MSNNQLSQEEFNAYLSNSASNTENDSVIVDNIGNMTYENIKTLTGLQNEKNSYDRPYFIVLYGPPGSGKSSSTPLIEDLGVPSSEYVTIILDDMITSVRKYRNVTKKLKENFNAKRITEGKFWYGISKAFNQTRTGKKEGESINAMRTNALKEALSQNKNIIYETTGASSSGQQFLKELFTDMIPSNYRIVILYPMVSQEELQKRVKSRANRFLEEAIPYYRSQKPGALGPMRENAIKFFKDYILETFLYGYKDTKQNKREIFKIVMYQNEELFSEPQKLEQRK